MITAVNTIICQVEDMARAVTFYRDVLGLTPGVQSPYWTDFQLGSVKVGLHPKFRPDASTGGGGWVIGLETPDIHAFRERIGDAVRGEFHQTPGGVVLDFVDPDGNPLQAIQLK